MLYPQQWYLPALLVLFLVHWGLLRSADARKTLIIVASLALLASLQPWFTVALVVWSALVYACGQQLPRTSGRRQLRLLVFAIVALVGYLAFFKYLPGLLLALFGDPEDKGQGMAWLHDNVVLPLGISYFTFRFLHYLIDAYRGQLVEHRFIDFALYSVFFPIIPAGPIERLERFLGNASDGFRGEDVAYGVQRIIIGVAKKLVLVDLVLVALLAAGPQAQIQAGSLAGVHVSAVWWFLIGSFLYAYLDFSAYTDIAVGTSRLFGYRICENFHFPIFQRNLSEFWKRTTSTCRCSAVPGDPAWHCMRA
jgi:alginate O-acetyltransferase complex protein AlgI